MPDRTPQQIQEELEEKVRLLILENDLLAERAEDTILLNLVAEKINIITDVKDLVATGLEQISLLKNIPFAACFALEDGLAIPLHSYSPTEDKDPELETISVSSDLAKSLEDGLCILSGQERKQFGCFNHLKSGNAILLPLGNRYGRRLMFVFADEGSDDLLSPLHSLLLQVVDMMAARIDNIELVGQLSLANQDLDKKVNDRTRELRASEKRVRTLFESAFDAFIVLDDNFCFRYVNHEACRSLGYDREQLLTMKVMDIDLETTPETTLRIMKAAREGENVPHEALFKRKDGSTYPVDIRIGPIEFDGQPLFLAQIRDISERNRLLEQLNQSQKMEAVGRLAGGIAHDFNNLLTALMGHVDLLKMALPDNVELTQEVDLIAATLDKAAALTHQLLAFSRKQVMDMNPFDLSVNISSLSLLLRRMVDENVELEIDLLPSPAFIFGDPGRIEQIIVNLVVNARDAMPSGGKLRIRTCRLERENDFLDPHHLSPPGTGQYLLLQVEDTGQGIEPSVLSKIFDPFFTTKEVGKGTGLGLALVYGLAKNHNALVRVRSEVGVGTVFEVIFPEILGADTLSADANTTATSGGNESILLVEDDSAIRTVMTRLIAPLGYELITAQDGEDALNVASEYGKEINLVLTDVIMPKMGGGDLVKELKIKYPHIKVIFMSGYTDDAVDQAEMCLPNTYFLQKPVTRQQLAEKIRMALDG